MATSQMIAPATSGRYMSALAKSVSPALKLMNVLTTATDASEIPWPLLLAPMLHCYLSLGYLQPQHHQGEEGQSWARRMLYQPKRLLRLRSWSGHDKRLSIPMNIRVFLQNKGREAPRVTSRRRPLTRRPGRKIMGPNEPGITPCGKQQPGAGRSGAPGRCGPSAAEHLKRVRAVVHRDDAVRRDDAEQVTGAVLDQRLGGELPPRRGDLHGVTGVPLRVLVLPPRALATNTSADVAVEATARSQGPTMFLLVMVSTGVPWLFSTIRHPAGVTWTIVVPVPWTLALSLKLLTRMLPAVSWPAEAGTAAIP